MSSAPHHMSQKYNTVAHGGPLSLTARRREGVQLLSRRTSSLLALR